MNAPNEPPRRAPKSTDLAAVMRRNVLATGAARVCSIGLDALAFVLIVRYLGPGDYGLYVSILAFLVLIDFAADLAILDITVREASRDAEHQNVWITAASILRLGIVGVGLLAYGAYVYLQRETFAGDSLRAALVGAFVLPVGVLRMPLAVFRARLRMDYELWVTVATRTTNLLLVCSVIASQGTLLHFLLVVITSRTLLGALSWVIAWRAFRLRLEVRRDAVWHLLRESAPMGISGLFVAVQLKADILLVSAILGHMAGGIYGVVAQLPEYFLYVPVIISTPILPLLSRFHGEAQRARFRALYQKLFDVLFSLIVPVAVVALLMPRLLVTLLFGDEYAEAAQVLPILLVAIVFMWASHAAAIATVATGLQRSFIWIQSICVVVYLSLNWLLIPEWGIRGAALARLAGTVIAPLLSLAVVYRKAGFGLRVGGATRTLIAALGMAMVIQILAPLPVAVTLVVAGMLYLAVLWVTGAAPWVLPPELEGKL